MFCHCVSNTSSKIACLWALRCSECQLCGAHGRRKTERLCAARKDNKIYTKDFSTTVGLCLLSAFVFTRSFFACAIALCCTKSAPSPPRPRRISFSQLPPPSRHIHVVSNPNVRYDDGIVKYQIQSIYFCAAPRFFRCCCVDSSAAELRLCEIVQRETEKGSESRRTGLMTIRITADMKFIFLLEWNKRKCAEAPFFLLLWPVCERKRVCSMVVRAHFSVLCCLSLCTCVNVHFI